MTTLRSPLLVQTPEAQSEEEELDIPRIDGDSESKEAIRDGRKSEGVRRDGRCTAAIGKRPAIQGDRSEDCSTQKENGKKRRKRRGREEAEAEAERGIEK